MLGFKVFTPHNIRPVYYPFFGNAKLNLRFCKISLSPLYHKSANIKSNGQRFSSHTREGQKTKPENFFPSMVSLLSNFLH